MPGVVGLYAFDNTWRMARFTYYALLALQHRGQETCGIATWTEDNQIHRYAGSGLVDMVLAKEDILQNLPGRVGVGCLSPQPEDAEHNIQPVVIREPRQIAVCLDGKIFNNPSLAVDAASRAMSDSEFVGRLLADELSKNQSALDAMEVVMKRVRGAYSLVALLDSGEMLAARDGLGVKPLVIGSFGFDYGAVASESCVFDVIGADFKTDIRPGEIYLFSHGSIERRQVSKPLPKWCAFEYVYLARPDSIINDISVYEARLNIGKQLAKEHPVNGADVVIGVPETAIPFAMAYANAQKLPLSLGFVQTGRRIRSAIRPTEFDRMVGVQLKLNPIRSAISGKDIILVDDSVVRGTTTRNTVNIMRNRHGAKEIHVRVGSPKLIALCPFGVEVPPEDELIARYLSSHEVSSVVGADSFHWLSVKGLVESLGVERSKLCLGCFTGHYPLTESEGEKAP